MASRVAAAASSLFPFKMAEKRWSAGETEEEPDADATGVVAGAAGETLMSGAGAAVSGVNGEM